MSSRRLAIVFGILALLMVVPGLAGAQGTGTPHDAGFNISYSCLSCHDLHAAPGPNLTRSATNAGLCQSCHNSTGDAKALAMPDSDMATPGVGGVSHRWQTPAKQSAYGATLPQASIFALHIDETDIQNPMIICSTCHNQHSNSTYRQEQRIQPVNHARGAGPATFGTITASSAAAPKGFLIDFVAGGAAGTATYRVSYDSGTSWFGWNGSQWGPYGAPYNARVTGSNQDLTNTPGEVQATFSGTFVGSTPGPSDQYKFYVAYPFYRAAPDSGDNSTGTRFCRACHSDRAQAYSSTPTWDGKSKSHPVGQPLNVSGRNFDRSTPLDPSGAPQGATPQYNSLVLDSSGNVQCTTCHAVHYAPSNSLYDPQGKR